MASKKITDLPVLTAPASGDLIELVDVSDTTDNPAGSSKEVTLANTITKAHGLSDSTAVGVASGVLTSGTDVAVVDGGTGASSASGARTNLGLAIGTDVVAPNQDTTGKSAKTDALNSATTVVNVSASTAPSTGQALIATDSTHATWQSLGGGGDALTSGTLAQFAPTTSLELKNLLTNETGSGAAIFATSPALVTPTGIVKGDVGLGNVDNTSDATKDAASTTLTNKTLTTPTIGSFANANHNHTNSAGGGQITDSALSAAVGISKGGTGQTTKAPAFDALSPMTTAGDIITGGASGTGTRLALGTTLQQIRVNAGATALEYFTPGASGGQTLVTKVVAASGADYTTLGAAITAASAGWTIYVTPGTYTETTITTSLNNITIIGDGPEATTLSFANTRATFSGTNVKIQGVKFDVTTGGLTMSGAKAELFDCHLAKNGNNTGLIMSADLAVCRNSQFISASSSDNYLASYSGTNARVSGNYYEAVLAAGFECVATSGNYVTFTGNTLKWISGSGSNTTMLFAAGTGSDVTSNIFLGGTATICAIRVDSGNRVNIAGNVLKDFADAVRLTSSAFRTNITGNTFDNSVNTSTRSVIVSNSATGMAITGNMFYNNASSNTGILINGASAGNATITGNYFIGYTTGVDSRVSAVVVSSNYISNGTSGTAISFASGSDFCVAVGNRIDSGSTGISIAANNITVQGNVIDAPTTTISITSSTTGHRIDGNYGDTTVLQRVSVQMKNTSGGTINAGNVVVLKSAAGGDEITTTTTAGDSKVFGVAEASISNNAYGNIMVKGKIVTLTADGTTDIAVGDYLSTFTTAGIAQKATVGSLAVIGDTAFAIALEAYTTNDSNGVLDALIISPRKL